MNNVGKNNINDSFDINKKWFIWWHSVIILRYLIHIRVQSKKKNVKFRSGFKTKQKEERISEMHVRMGITYKTGSKREPK